MSSHTTPTPAKPTLSQWRLTSDEGMKEQAVRLLRMQMQGMTDSPVYLNLRTCFEAGKRTRARRGLPEIP